MKTLRFKLEGRRAFLVDKYYSDKLKALLSYTSPGARFSPAYNRRDRDGNRLWDGKISFVKYDSLSVGLLIGAHKELKLAGYNCEVVGWKHRPQVGTLPGFWEKDEEYEFQNTACQAILSSLNKGGGTILSATGTGKTKLAAQVFSHIRGNCLFIVDQVNLLYQSQKEIESWLGESVGIIGNGKFNPKRITVATIQTLFKAPKNQQSRDFAKHIDVVFIDELHKQMSRRNFSVVNTIKPKAVIGMTATLQMKKKEIRWKVYSISGPILFEFPVEKGIEQGVLSNCAVVQLRVPERSFRSYGYTEDGEALSGPNLTYSRNVLGNVHINELVPKLVKAALKREYAVVILAERLRHVRLLKKILDDFFPKIIQGSVKESRRQKIIKKFELGQYNLIIASTVFTKGVNIKRISLIIDLAQRKSKNDAMQKLGRGLRKHKDKKYGLIYIDLSTEPSMKAAGSSRRNAFKKAGIQVKVLDWTEVKDVKEILSVGKGLLKMKR